MIIGLLKESFPGERRVALVPQDFAALQKAQLSVVVEAGAGAAAGYPDAAYQSAGAKLLTRAEVFTQADLLVQVRAGGANPAFCATDLAQMRAGQGLIAFLEPLSEPKLMQSLAEKEITAFSMDLIPRITRAQSMDALSAMGTIIGYKAVLLAASALPKMFPMLMTAAGTVPPARVFVIGAGVAGLQAIATAKRLGAKVQAYDVRSAVKEQVESVGAKFVELPLETGEAEDKGGYAKELAAAKIQQQQELMAEVVAYNDVVITTALIPGKKAPLLLTAAMVKRMQPSSVLVDLAAERGGNCELTRPGETVVVNGVTILGPVNLASEVPYHASQMYSRNLTTFLRNLVKDGQIMLNISDEIIAETLVTHKGEVVQARVKDLIAA